MKIKFDYKWVALSVTTIGSLMASLDSTIVVIGLPTILQDLHASIVHGVWIITGYTLMMTILLVILGRMADLYGRVKLYNLGFAIFTAGSLFCALSQTGAQLIIFRFFQGIGAALLTANSIAIITDAFPRKELGVGLGTNAMVWSIGAMAGYTLGGIMVTYFGWRSIFLVNVPIGIFGTIWGYRQLKEIGVRPQGQKFDYFGAILYCIGLTTILLGLTIGNPASGRNLAIIVTGLVFFTVVIFIELRQRYPTLDLTLFKTRLFAAGTIASFLNSVSLNCSPFLRSLFLQLILGYSALKTGIVLIPMQIVGIMLNPISGRLADKYGSRVLCSIGLALNAAALIWFSTLNANSSYSAILISLIFFGIGTALFISPNISSIMSSVPAEKRGVANGIRATLNQTANSISVPFSLLLMSLVMPYDKLSQIVNNSQLIASNEVHIFQNAINLACFILGIITFLAIIPILLRAPKEQPVEKALEKPNS